MADPVEPFNITYQFPLHSLPDVRPNTRVVAICGITSTPDADGNNPCDPSLAGWCHAQFHLMHHIFKNQGVKQKWITSVSPTSLVEDFGELTYADSEGNRKVVLDKSMLGIELERDMKIVDPANLHMSLKLTLDFEASLSRVHSQPIMLLIFGHGRMKESGMWIGDSLFTPQNLRDWTDGALVAVVTPNPFAGPQMGWVTMPNLHLGELPDSLESSRPDSYEGSERVNRVCGSVWLSEVLKSRALAPLLKEGDAVDGGTKEADRKDLVDAVHTALICGTGRASGINFQSDVDRWEIDYRSRFGLPLPQWQLRWDSLPNPSSIPDTASPPSPDSISSSGSTFDSSSSGSTLDSSTTSTPVELDASVDDQCRTSYRHKLLPLISAYRATLPGDPNSGPEALLTLLMRRVTLDPSCSMSRMRAVCSHIEYRLHLMELADRYVALLDLEVPGGSCASFDIQEWEGDQAPAQLAEYQEVIKKVAASRIFPNPVVVKQGRAFNKPMQYLCALFVRIGITGEELMEDIRDLKLYHDEKLRAASRILESDRSVTDAMTKIRDQSHDAYESACGECAGSKIFAGGPWTLF